MLARKIYYLEKVNRQQWMKPEEIEKLQTKKLRAIIKHAYKTVPFYRRKWKGIDIDKIRTKEDLSLLPVITREEIKANQKDIMSNEFSPLQLHHESTSGSSGSQLHVYFDHDSYDYLEAVYARALFAVGYRPWHKLAYVWFPPYKETKFYERLGIMKKHYIPSIADEETQLKMLLNINPEVIYSFPTTLFLISNLMKQKNIDSVKPKLIISHAELLTDKFRTFFEETFQCNVYDQYGTTEFNRMGWECTLRKGFHMDCDSVLIEFLKDGEYADLEEPGEVVVTGLINKAMPLIRYDLGDIGYSSEELCDCGRGLPLIRIIEGRDDDFVYLPSGRRVGPREILNNLYDVLRFRNEISKLKIVQKSKDKIRVKIVETTPLSDEVKREILDVLNRVFGEPVEIGIEIVDDIPKNKHGKLRAVESKVKM